MVQARAEQYERRNEEDSLMAETPAGQHPRGTLLLMGLYGLFFAISWFAVYALVYLQRGGVTP